jgi:hypothetical protein
MSDAAMRPTKNEEPAADDVGVPEAEPRTAAAGGLLQLKLST